MMTVHRYTSSDKSTWNSFIAKSANATFILDRGFMDYHSDRFKDHSLLLYEKDRLIALFPANGKGGIIFSHEGLTYGGLILLPNTGLVRALSCFYAITKYYFDRNIHTISYKPAPSYLHVQQTYYDLYALFLLRAALSATNTGFIVDLQSPSVIAKHHIRQIQKARNSGVRIVKDSTFNRFWNEILIPHLKERFHTSPVHSLEEITLLQQKFPKNIYQYVVQINEHIVGGSTIFVDRGIAHTQYIASNNEGRKTGSLDYLFWHLLTHEFRRLRYLSFGTSNMGSSDGRMLARGLVAWKEKFGAIMFPQTCYDIQTKNYSELQSYK